MSKRQELIEKLRLVMDGWGYGDGTINKEKAIECIAPYIEAREREQIARIVEPLRHYKFDRWIGKSYPSVWMDTNCDQCQQKHKAIDKSLAIADRQGFNCYKERKCMREIKFRAWHTEAKEMLIGNGTDDPLRWKNDGQPVEIMQYTGLKDKNGREIWEGDVIRTRDNFIFPVLWAEDIACFECADRTSSRTLYGYHKDGVEVIGNIYDNPELLEAK